MLSKEAPRAMPPMALGTRTFGPSASWRAEFSGLWSDKVRFAHGPQQRGGGGGGTGWAHKASCHLRSRSHQYCRPKELFKYIVRSILTDARDV